MNFLMFYCVCGFACAVYIHIRRRNAPGVSPAGPLNFFTVLLTWPLWLALQLFYRPKTSGKKLNFKKTDASYYRRWLVEKIAVAEQSKRLDVSELFTALMVPVGKFSLTGPAELIPAGRYNDNDAAKFEAGCYIISVVDRYLTAHMANKRRQVMEAVLSGFANLSATALKLPLEKAGSHLNNRLDLYGTLFRDGESEVEIISRFTAYAVHASSKGVVAEGEPEYSMDTAIMSLSTMVWAKSYGKASIDILERFNKANVPSETSRFELEPNLKRAEQLKKEEKYEEAIELLNVIVGKFPDSDSAWSLRGLCQVHIQNGPGAVKDLDEAIKLNPNEPEHYMARGVIFTSGILGALMESTIKDQDLGEDAYQFDKAVADYSAAIALRPRHAPYYRDRANLLLLPRGPASIKYRHQALADSERAFRLNPIDESIISLRSNARHLNGLDRPDASPLIRSQTGTMLQVKDLGTDLMSGYDTLREKLSRIPLSQMERFDSLWMELILAKVGAIERTIKSELKDEEFAISTTDYLRAFIEHAVTNEARLLNSKVYFENNKARAEAKYRDEFKDNLYGHIGAVVGMLSRSSFVPKHKAGEQKSSEREQIASILAQEIRATYARVRKFSVTG